ncbi:MAG: gamma-glutamyl-gamma-aminobutyrate hydrolase family protein [Armatimonadetes bacterium]|jgi:gamma-glutamyl-gamma-aminobutyrate hydrolase PuuD|nr:gamma-glutamyl-gamma-aminobutyrate hydrolase family protein [Armatimonadota bacterium]
MTTEKSPLIGITMGIGPDGSRNGRDFLSYSTAVRNGGGEAVSLGHGRHGRFDECDGLLLSGGCDVHPKHVKRLPGDEELTDDEVMAKYKIKTEKMRDEVEMRMARQALKQGKPVLGICRGFQVLGVALGCTLIGDITTFKPNTLVHYAVNGISSRHEIKIEPGSLMERVYNSTSIVINSRHHQGFTPELISDKLQVTAIAPDGIVEAAEMPGYNFVVGVQWHPEKQSDEFINSISVPLFRAFVDASAQWRRSQ